MRVSGPDDSHAPVTVQQIHDCRAVSKSTMGAKKYVKKKASVRGTNTNCRYTKTHPTIVSETITAKREREILRS